MKKLFVFVFVLLAACSASQGSGTTVTFLTPTTAFPAPGTTATVSASPSTTSTLPPSTTSSLVGTTTTLSLGNWAELPLVVTGFGAMGWWDGTDWIAAEGAGFLPIQGGESYQIAAENIEVVTVGGPPQLVCEPVNNLGVLLEDDQVMGEWPGPYGVAISAPWDIHPHLFDTFEDDGTYATFASVLLAERGLNVASPVIKQLLRVDLEGDGTNEVLVVAEDIQGGFLPELGDYSIVFMRRVVEGEVQTAILGETVITDPENQFVIGFSIGTVADLSGDGKMEIVVNSAYFEGLGVEMWEYVDDDIGPVSYLQTGCGS